jgi:SanA protein
LKTPKNSFLKGLIKAFIILIPLGFFAVWLADFTVSKSARGKLFNQINQTPNFKTGLVPGTSKFLTNGNINWYYKYRIDATVNLWKAGKIKYVLVSGDNGTRNYNEPETFFQDLVLQGIDSDAIFLDYAGFRTFDSMIRAKEVFGQDSLLVISQEFHKERALYIAEKEGIFACAFNAKNPGRLSGIRMQIREKLARVKVIMDYWFGNSPKFLGKKILIPKQAD